MKKTYTWSVAAYAALKVSPQIVGETLAAIEERDGKLEPAAVVEAATPKKSPLHALFEWDNTEAAQLYREKQAAYLIRSIKVVVEQAVPTTTRAFVSVQVADQPREYKPIDAVLADTAMRASLLQRALRDLRAWQQKYAGLVELAALFKAQEEILARHEKAS